VLKGVVMKGTRFVHLLSHDSRAALISAILAVIEKLILNRLTIWC
jgi:hypothetical protein